MDGRVVGYEYTYRLSTNDAIIPLYDVALVPGAKSFLFEIRTNFNVKLRRNDEYEVIDSERLDTCVWEHDGGRTTLNFFVRGRLEDYWMVHMEICRFANEAYDFAKKIADDPLHAFLRVIPVVVDFHVCTVQQENETLNATMERSICAERLVPLDLSASTTARRKKPFDPIGSQLTIISPLIRVKNVDEGLALMQVCHICSRNPSIGAQISVLRGCRHAFHSHCLVRSLKKSMLCPVCHSSALLEWHITIGESQV